MKRLFVLLVIWTKFAFSATSTLYQYGLLTDALHGQYNQITTVANIARYSDFAMGAGIGLGELIGVDGNFYLTDSYGHLRHLKKSDRVSFASAAKFKPEYNLGFSISYISSLAQLEDQIEQSLPDKNIMYAIKITGYFDKLHARSEDIDTVPYTPIVKWMQFHQHEFDCDEQKSTIVMFRIPAELSNLGVKYHAHFVNESRTLGGHVFNVVAMHHDLNVEITPLYKAVVYLRKQSVAVKDADDLQRSKFYSVVERNSTESR